MPGYYHRQRGGHCDDGSHAEWYSDEDDGKGESDEEEEFGEDQDVRSNFARTSTSETIKRLLLEQARAGKKPVSKGSPSRLNLTESPEEQMKKPSMYLRTMPEAGRHTHGQEDNATFSTNEGPFALEMALTAVTSSSKGEEPCTEVAIASSPSGLEKRDSKLEVSREVDGVSFQDFAVKPDQKGKGPQTRPVKPDPPARPRWR